MRESGRGGDWREKSEGEKGGERIEREESE